MQPVQQLRSYGAHSHQFQDRELCGFPASGTEREEPGVDELVVCVDAKFTACPEALGRARVATAENERQEGGHDHPVFEHRNTPGFSEKSAAKRSAAHMRDARRFIAREVSQGVQRDVLD